MKASQSTRSRTWKLLLDGIDLENISVSLTINPTAWILLAMYVVLGGAARL